MKFPRSFVFVAVLVLAISTLPVAAAAPAQTGKENAAARIADATAAQTQILTDLLSKLPAQALPAVQDAILASEHGHETALAALSKQPGTESASIKNAKGEASSDTENATVGLTHARESVAAGFDKSIATLQGLLGTLPPEAVTHVEAALAKVQAQRAVALQNLDGLISGVTPNRASVNRPDRPDRPQKPDRPEKVDRPEILDRPLLPDRPEKPDHPSGRP